MIPKVVYSQRAAHRENQVISAFAEGSKQRRIHLVVDDMSLDSTALSTRVLRDFDGHPAIFFETTAKDGQHVLCVERSKSADDSASIVTTRADGRSTSHARFVSQKRALAARFAATKTPEAIDTLTDLVILASHAELFGADAFVTGAQDLVAMAGAGFLQGANIMSAEEAIALTGLYLRTRGDFAHVHSGRSSVTYGQLGFYRTLALELLPQSDRWLHHTPAASSPWERAPRDLVDAVIIRVERALRARDRLHRLFLISRDHETSHEALFYFDIFLLSLSGAFDAIAQIAHTAYAIEGPAHAISWRKERKNRQGNETWMDRLRRAAPEVAKIMSRSTSSRDALEAIAPLRNTIHGEPLSTIGFHDADRIDTEYPMIVPPANRADILKLVRRRGGENMWGIRQISKGSEHIVLDVPTFVERVFIEVVEAFDKLMAAIKVERLSDRLPENFGGLSDAESLVRIRLLSGLPVRSSK